MLAYYYIWFDDRSWRRAKRDVPLLGPYNSSDATVMRQHIADASAAGIGGFLVSWKNTAKLTERLHRLAGAARESGFKLGIVYQGLDFDRNPLPAEQITADLAVFATQFADDPVFRIWERPVVLLTGTDRWTLEQLAGFKAALGGKADLLASAKSVEEYRRVSGVVAGNAYYWSSGDPTKDWFAERLQAIGSAVRSSGGLCIAPAAPGFDARDVGGSTSVPRQGGRTLKSELQAAADTHPDAVGIISWNEFSENTYIEPSRDEGYTALDTVARFDDREPVSRHEPPPVGTAGPHWTGWNTMALVFLVSMVALLVAARRRQAVRAGA